MMIMTKDGWRPLYTPSKTVAEPPVEPSSTRYQDKWNSMSFHDKYVELASLVVFKKRDF